MLCQRGSATLLVLLVAAFFISCHKNEAISIERGPNNGAQDQPPLGPPIPLAQCDTIDGDDDSKNLLGCAQVALKNAHATWAVNTPRATTETKLDRAFANLAGCKGTSAMIIGHGQSGLIHIGGGDYASSQRSWFIADINGYGSDPQPWNVDLWDKGLTNHKLTNKFHEITLLGCNTGAPPYATQLLTAFSSRTSALVKAPTSRVWCDENYQLHLEAGAGFTTAKDGKVIEFAPVPPLHPLGLQEHFSSLKIAESEEPHFSSLSLESIKAIRLCLFSNPAHRIDSPKQCRLLSAAGKKRLVESVFFGDPFQPHAVPNSDVSGTIELFQGTPTEKCERNQGCYLLHVLNDDLIADFSTKTYFYVSDRFRASWFLLE